MSKEIEQTDASLGARLPQTAQALIETRRKGSLRVPDQLRPNMSVDSSYGSNFEKGIYAIECRLLYPQCLHRID